MGAFDATTRAAAAGYDIASAMVNGVQSHAAKAGRAAAPAQTGIYWGIIGFGVAIIILGFGLRSMNRRTVVATRGLAASTAEELARLAGLRDHGILTKQEFEMQKQRILRS